MARKIWIDVGALLTYASSGHRLSGIQRLEFELCRALNALPESKDRVFFVRHDRRQGLVETPWDAVEAAYGVLTSGSPRKLKAATSATARVWLALRAATGVLPQDLRRIAIQQLELLVDLSQLLRTRARDSADALKRRWRLRDSGASRASKAADNLVNAVQPGDILAVLGAGWADVAPFERTVQAKGLRFALLIYDIIPLRRPEWFEQRLAAIFRTWFERALPLSDAVLTISAATARDVTTYANSAGLKLRAAPTPIPIGTGFRKGMAGQPPWRRVRPDHLPAPDTYVLLVSTIEARKNHTLLFRVWRRLLEEMPPESVPTLVFAGRVGWLVSDLMVQLRNCRFLDGKIIHVQSPTDDELAALYDGCLFTLFPSFYEGWGLPVTESYAFGRPCIVSRATSLPEAGGSLARYIDPDNAADAYRVIRETIEDPAGLIQWRDRVQREFRPVEWTESARAVLQALDGGVPDAGASKMRLSA